MAKAEEWDRWGPEPVRGGLHLRDPQRRGRRRVGEVQRALLLAAALPQTARDPGCTCKIMSQFLDG